MSQGSASGVSARRPSPVWMQEVADAVQAERGARASRPVTRAIGPAKRLKERGSPLRAAFAVDLRERGSDIDLDAMQDLRLRSLEDDQQEFRVHEVLVHEPERLVVGASAQAREPLELIANNDPAFILTALQEQLSTLSEPGLAVGLAEGRASSKAPAEQRSTAEPGSKLPLNPRQRAAFAATIAPGLNAVWGPPGTGKTQVLAVVLAHVVAQGRSALLVSNTNVAVDQALLKAAQGAPVRPGQLVRVGTPTLDEVAEHSFLPLHRACEWRAVKERRRLDQIKLRASELLDTPVLRALEQARMLLREHLFDPAAFQEAKERLENAARLVAVRRRLDAAQRQLEVARNARAAAVVASAKAATAAAAVAEAADAFRRIDELQEEIARVEDDLRLRHARMRRTTEALTETYQSLISLEQGPVRQWRRRRRERRQLEERRKEQRKELDRLGEALARDEQNKREIQQLAEERIPQLHEAARPHDRQAVALAATARAEAERALRQAEADMEHCRSHYDAVNHEAEQAERSPQPREGDIDAVRNAEALDLPALPDRLHALEGEAKPLLDELEQLEREEDLLRGNIAKAQGLVLQEASVVATTLARVAFDRSIRSRRYDYVLVDEAACALAPFVVLAASRAAIGVTLFGDFLQNGPISEYCQSDHRRVGRLATNVRRWLELDCFGLLG
jgi:AAA domain